LPGTQYSDVSITINRFADKTANNVLKTAMLNNMATVAMEQKAI
jgi:hypothetical protein